MWNVTLSQDKVSSLLEGYVVYSYSRPGRLPHCLISAVSSRRNLIGALSSSCTLVSQRALTKPFTRDVAASFPVRKHKGSTIFGSEALVQIGPFSCSPVSANALPSRW